MHESGEFLQFGLDHAGVDGVAVCRTKIKDLYFASQLNYLSDA